MSSYLWRYYLENDVERFQRLLQGSQSNPHISTHRGSAHKPGLTTPTGSFKSPSAGLARKHRPGSPPANVILTSKMLKELDPMGRTVLHLACTEPGRLPFVTALLSHPLTDPSVADIESGWTALHRALYHGNISAARVIMSLCPASWNLLKLKDHAGDSPWEVFEATVHKIENTFDHNHSSDVGEYSDSEQEVDNLAVAEEGDERRGDEVFAWGSNKNLNLGFIGGDDRSYPERVPLQRPRPLLLEQAKRRYSNLPENHGKSVEELLDAFILFNPMQISDIHLSKFHTAIVTTDPHSNLFLCGFGRGGRLGFGDEQNVQFTFRPLLSSLLPKKRVQKVALGQDHTVVVLDGGEVWTWGSNQAGQLGYALPQKTSKEESNQSTPRQVFGLIKRESIIGCAASRIHTAVFTEDALFTFGKNDGQLGILDSSDATTLEIQSTPRKVSANFLNGTKIKEVVAIDKATVILLESHEVWILASHAYSRLSFPSERFVGLPAGAKNITRYDAGSNVITKITGGGDTLCALSEVGNVFAVDVEATLKERAARGSGKIAWTPQRAWSLRKRHMAVRDVDVGADGNIIICTQSGSVWRRMKRVKIKEGGGDGGRYKFDRVPGLSRITTVRSNTTGAFAAIRMDSDFMQKGLTVEPQGLWEDISQMLSFNELFDDEDVEDLGLVDNNDDEWGYGPKPRPKQYGGAVKWFMQGTVEEDLKTHLSDLGLHKELRGWDISVSTSKYESIDLPVHSFILSRSRALRKLITQGSGSIAGICEILSTECGLRIVFHDIELLTMLNLVFYLYIDTVVDLWHQRNISKEQTNFFKSLRSEMARVTTALELKHLAEAVGRMHYPPRCMDKDLQLASMDPDFFHTADMIIDVADGESIAVHSALMRVRCPFFEALYGGGTGGRWLLGRQRDADPDIHVDMKHVQREIMKIVVSWLYYDWDAEGFDGIRVGVKDGDVDQYLDFVLDVMSTANELMLERLSQVCQQVVGRYVNIRNAAGLLTAVAPCSERDFKEKCLQYICSNLEVMLEHHLLDELDSDLMAELDETVRSNQKRLFPHSRSSKQEEWLLEKYPSLKLDSEKEKASLIAHYIAISDVPSLSTSSRNYSGFAQTSSLPSSSPTRKARRKSSKTAIQGSPLVKPIHGHEDIFSMDNDEILPSSSPTRFSLSLSGIDVTTSVTKDIKGKAPVNVWGEPHLSPRYASPKQDPFEPSTPPHKLHAPWTTPSSSVKLDMKEIMAQASAAASGKSALTAQLSASPTTLPKQSTPKQDSAFKLSQKERKRQQQQQQQQQPSLSVPSTPDKKVAWNINGTPQTTRVSLKEVLASPSTPTEKTPQKKPQTPATSPAAIPSTPTQQRRTVLATHTSSPTPTASSPISRPPPPPPPLMPRPTHFLPLSLQDIIDQEEAQKELIKEYSSKRSLQEIQEEQEFLRWWENESKRVQEAEIAQEQKKKGGQRGGRSGDGRSGGGGRGRGRSKGRGGRGETSGSAGRGKGGGGTVAAV